MKFRFKEKRIGNVSNFSDLLAAISDQYSLSAPMQIEEIKSKWKDIAGAILAVHTEPDRIFKKTLFVKSDHPVYSNEINMSTSRLIDEINRLAGGSIVKNIRTELKKSPSPFRKNKG